MLGLWMYFWEWDGGEPEPPPEPPEHWNAMTSMTSNSGGGNIEVGE